MSGRDKLPERAPISDVGPALRKMLARARAARLTTKDWRALAAIIDRTASWSRLEDRVTHGVLRELSGLDRSDLRKSLRRLAAEGVIGYEPGRGSRFSRILLAPLMLDGREATPPPSEEGESAPLAAVPEPEQVPPSSRAVPPPSEGGEAAPHERGGQRLGLSERTPWATDVAHEHASAAAEGGRVLGQNKLVEECVVCGRPFLDGERGSADHTCPACLALWKGLVTEREADELRLLHELYARTEVPAA